MRILFFTDSHEDYLADSLLHGFRTLYGSDCVDFPKCEIMYKNCADSIKQQVRGNGFSLYSGLLEDIQVDRFNIKEKIISNFFDLIIFSNIQRQFGFFVQYRPWLSGKNTIFLDGEDTTQPYPARGFWWRRPYYWFLPNAHKDFLYFKREWSFSSHFSIYRRFLPLFLRRILPRYKNLRSISFSFPAEKIIQYFPKKQKDFPLHIVDHELANYLENTKETYAFESEFDYYDDLRQSRYGITTKRAGWDCLRHYEIAANLAVPCFKNLDTKPIFSGPYGLNDKNSISYKNLNDLMHKISQISETDYKALQLGAQDWINEQITTNRAMQIINEFNKFNEYKNNI